MNDLEGQLTQAQQEIAVKDRLIAALAFVAVIWSVKVAEVVFHADFGRFGVLPRHLEGLWGLLTMPVLHADFGHVGANSIPAFVLIMATLHFYRKIALRVILGTWLGSALMVWVFARTALHIGASALIYGLAAFLFFSGIFRRDTKSIAIAMCVAFLYGSMVWGMLPIYPDVSWEGHLFGAVTGTLLAYRYRQFNRPQPTPEWDDGSADHLPWHLTDEPEKPIVNRPYF